MADGEEPGQAEAGGEPGAGSPAAAAAAVQVLVATDVCLRALDGRGTPLGLPLLVNYDLAQRKVRALPLSEQRRKQCLPWNAIPLPVPDLECE